MLLQRGTIELVFPECMKAVLYLMKTYPRIREVFYLNDFHRLQECLKGFRLPFDCQKGRLLLGQTIQDRAQERDPSSDFKTNNHSTISQSVVTSLSNFQNLSPRSRSALRQHLKVVKLEKLKKTKERMHLKDEITLNLKLQHERKVLRKFERENPGKIE